MTTPEQAAARICAAIEPAIAAELAASRTTILAEVGPLERLALGHLWGPVERESRRLVHTAVTCVCRDLGTLTVNEAAVRALGPAPTPTPKP